MYKEKRQRREHINGEAKGRRGLMSKCEEKDRLAKVAFKELEIEVSRAYD